MNQLIHNPPPPQLSLWKLSKVTLKLLFQGSVDDITIIHLRKLTHSPTLQRGIIQVTTYVHGVHYVSVVSWIQPNQRELSMDCNGIIIESLFQVS